MSFRQTAIAFIVAASAAPGAFAQTGGQWFGGEIGFVPDPPKSTVTREQVRQDLLDFIKRGGQLAAGERAYFDPAEPVVRTAAPLLNTQQMGAPAEVDPYANGGPN